ncbi:DUF6266 family protein [Sphingobacterium luzhongxinii]|uniref:DUF6266 family protein n=1 Tax=Sphingobacterium luzhongxinii TaxID=2654181 RepID=UPI0013DC0C50|nr:DUF6266 family protein [Sphingobacterium sp. xlx-73]
MGRIRQGANGGFRGKAGSVVGSSWKGIDYIKGLPKKSSKPPTMAQLETQAKFKLLMRFLTSVNMFLQVGFGHKQNSKSTPANVAFQFNLFKAIAGAYPNYTLDYANISFSDGGLFSAGTVTAEFDTDKINVTWDVSASKRLNKLGDDQLFILAYHPQKNEFLTTDDVPLREDGTAVMAVPQHLRQGDIHVWYFMADRTEKQVSNTSYLGLITI